MAFAQLCAWYLVFVKSSVNKRRFMSTLRLKSLIPSKMNLGTDCTSINCMVLNLIMQANKIY